MILWHLPAFVDVQVQISKSEKQITIVAICHVCESHQDTSFDIFI